MTSFRIPLLLLALLVAVTAIVAPGCGSVKRPGIDAQFALRDTDGSGPKPQFYLTDTKPYTRVGSNDSLIHDIWKIESEDYPKQIRLYARVFDTTGNFITHLAPPVAPTQEYWTSLQEKLGRRTVPVKDFTVREYGENDSLPFAVNLLIDYSGSMNDVMDALATGTEMFIRLKQPQDLVAITGFNKDVDVKVPFGNDKDALIAAYRARKDQGFGRYSAFYDGLVKSIRMFDSLPADVPRILVAFTDGDDNYSQGTIRDVFREAQERGIRVFTVGFGYTQDELLNYVSENTGGKYYQITSKAELIKVFKEIYRSLRNYYLVTYTPPVFAGKHFVSLQLSLPGRDSLVARGAYDKSDINPFRDPDNPIYKKIAFDFNKSTLKPEAQSIIEELVDQLERYDRVWLEVQGHTDNIGAEEFNLRLSEARARAVVDALVAKGIEAKRLKPRGMGMLYPLVPNDSEENRATNRRTEFRILKR
ncbi:MAG: OmpA family protein [Candidatus Kapaibacterium sp.]